MKPQSMNPFVVTALAIGIMTCGGDPAAGTRQAGLGFYAKPDRIIAEIKGKEQGPADHFLLGVAYKNQKKYKTALFHLAASAFDTHRNPGLKLFPQPMYHFVREFHLKSDLYDEALFEIAGIMYLYREYEHTVKFLDLIGSGRRGLLRDAKLLKAQALAALKKTDEARRILEDSVTSYTDAYSRSLIHFRIGSILENTGDAKGAITRYSQVMAADFESWQAALAAARVQGIRQTTDIALSADQRLLLGRALSRTKKTADAVALLDELYREKENDAAVRAALVSALVRHGDIPRAETIAKKDTTGQLLKACAEELWSIGKKRQAATIYERLVNADDAAVKQLAQKRVAQGMEERKAAGFESYLIKYKDAYQDRTAEYFLWLLGKHALKAGQEDKAAAYFTESLRIHPDGPHSDRCRFWLYRMSEKKRDNAKAMQYAGELALRNPDSSYTWIIIKRIAASQSAEALRGAWEKARSAGSDPSAYLYHTLLLAKDRDFDARDGRIKDLSRNEVKQYRSLESDIDALDASSDGRAIAKQVAPFFRIGYLPAIQRELQLLPENPKGSADRYIILAHYGKKYGNPFYTVKSTIELMKLRKLKENITLMPRGLLTLLFPQPFKDCIRENAKTYAIDTNIIYAVIKAESLFNHDAVSSAGAIGLMQLMPATARGIARDLKVSDYDLTDPCTSIRFGAKYLSWLYRYTHQNFEHMVAGYNAGAGNVDKWKSRPGFNDIDYFMEFNPFAETRYYILRTGKFLTQYAIIYGRQ